MLLWREFFRELKKDWKMLPNIVTELRLIFCFLPGILLVIEPNNLKVRVVCMLVMLFVAATDAADGYLARTRGEVSRLGQMLDPLVDKVLAAATLIFLSFFSDQAIYLLVFSTVRAVSISARASNYKKHGLDVQVVYSGKVNTAVITIAMAMLFVPIEGLWRTTTNLALVATYAMSLYSWYDYFKSYPKIRK